MAGVIGIVALVLGIVSFLYNYETSVVGAGTAAGGIIAFLITSEALDQIGRADLIVIPALSWPYRAWWGCRSPTRC